MLLSLLQCGNAATPSTGSQQRCCADRRRRTEKLAPWQLLGFNLNNFPYLFVAKPKTPTRTGAV
jgi:hypothetical protein